MLGIFWAKHNHVFFLFLFSNFQDDLLGIDVCICAEMDGNCGYLWLFHVVSGIQQEIAEQKGCS